MYESKQSFQNRIHTKHTHTIFERKHFVVFFLHGSANKFTLYDSIAKKEERKNRALNTYTINHTVRNPSISAQMSGWVFCMCLYIQLNRQQ